MPSNKIEGLANLGAMFRQAGADIEQKLSRRMVASAGTVLKREAKAIALANGSKRTGAMVSNIAIKREKTPKGLTQYNLGVRTGRDLGSKAEKKLVIGANGRVKTQYVRDPYYWVMVETGQKPHVIEPKRPGGAIAFPGSSGAMRFAKSIRHPGADPKPFLAPALENKKADAIKAMEKPIAAELKKKAIK